MDLSFVKNEYLVRKFEINRPYQKFEIELPTSVKKVEALSVTHDYYDNPEISLGQVSLLSKDKNDIILSASLQGSPLYFYIPNLYQRASFQYFSYTDKAYVAKSNYLNCCIGTTANRNGGNNITRKGDQLLADLVHQYGDNGLPFRIADPNKKHVFTGGRKPTPLDDTSKGFKAGSLWVFGTELYQCDSAAFKHAVWSGYNGGTEWSWFTILTDQKPYELLFRNKRFAFEEKFTEVAIQSDSRYIDVVVHKTEKLPNNPYLLNNGQEISYNLWVTLVCERI